MLNKVHNFNGVLEMLRQEISAGDIPSDDLFDCLYPVSVRHLSREFWTPTLAAARAAHFLTQSANRILDVGSGSGKFTLLAALLFPEKSFVGVEYRPTLVELSTQIAEKAELKNVEFVEGNAFDLDWQQFDGFYIYNPFHEQRHTSESLGYIDNHAIELSEQNYSKSALETQARLAALPEGTSVVLYNGFHDSLELPLGYSKLERSFVNGIALVKAIKGRRMER